MNKDLAKINEILGNTLSEEKIIDLNEYQTTIVKKIKQGGDFISVREPNSGSTMAIAIGSLIKSPVHHEGSPRVIIITKDTTTARALQIKMKTWVRKTMIEVEVADDKGNIIQQRNDIFDGAEIVVGNIRRIYDLYIQNGINIRELNLLIVDDADFVVTDAKSFMYFNRLNESLPSKCQKAIFTKEYNSKVEKLAEIFCINPIIL